MGSFHSEDNKVVYRAPRGAEARVPVTARVSPATAEQLKAKAKTKGISLSQLAAAILEEAVG